MPPGGSRGEERACSRGRSLGFKMNLRLVPADTLYTKSCGGPSQNVALCPSVGWFPDDDTTHDLNYTSIK